jgi:hypothetical protein
MTWLLVAACWQALDPSPRGSGWPACREQRKLWNMYVACEDLVDAASCDANEAKYNCSWGGEPAFCGANVGHNCEGGSQTASCKIWTAEKKIEAACAKATSKTACDADDACEWYARDASCYVSAYGYSIGARELGSKTAEAYAGQYKACSKLTTKQACLDEPLPAGTPGRASAYTPSPSPSPARSSAVTLLPVATCAAAALLWVAVVAAGWASS